MLRLLEDVSMVNVNITWQSSQGLSNIHFAAQSGSIRLLKGVLTRYLNHSLNIPLFTTDHDSTTPMHSAVRSGNMKMVEYLANMKGSPVYERDIRGYSPLHEAAAGGFCDIVQYLVEVHGYQLEQCTRDGQTALYLSAKNGHATVVKFLLQKDQTHLHKLNIEAKDVHTAGDKYSLLHVASKYGHLEVVKTCLESGANRDQLSGTWQHTALYISAKCGHAHIVKLFLNDVEGSFHKTQFLSVNKFNVEQKDEYTVLHVAAKFGYVEIMKECFLHGSNIDQPSHKLGHTPLYLALKNGHLPAVEFLYKESSAEINDFVYDDEDEDGVTALMLAVINRHLHVVKFLLKHGADADKPSKNFGNTALHLAPCYPNLHILRYISENSEVDLNKANKLGMTPFLVAVAQSKDKMVQYLAGRSGIKINDTDNDNESALHIALRYADAPLEFAEYLLGVGIDPNIQNKNGKTALHIAVEVCDDSKIIHCLLKRKDVNAHLKDNDGDNVLHLATRKNNLNCVRTLIEQTGIDVNETNLAQQTALHIAMRGATDSNTVKIVDLLLKNTSISKKSCQTALKDARSLASATKSSTLYLSIIISKLSRFLR